MRLSQQGSRFQSYVFFSKIILKTKYKTSRMKVVELPTTKVRVQFTIRGMFLSPSFISFNVVSPMEEFDPPGYVGDGIFKCRKFVVSIAG